MEAEVCPAAIKAAQISPQRWGERKTEAFCSEYPRVDRVVVPLVRAVHFRTVLKKRWILRLSLTSPSAPACIATRLQSRPMPFVSTQLAGNPLGCHIRQPIRNHEFGCDPLAEWADCRASGS